MQNEKQIIISSFKASISVIPYEKNLKLHT